MWDYARHQGMQAGYRGSVELKAKNGDRYCLNAFDGDVLKIAEQLVDKISKKALMKAQEFNMKFNDGVIYYVERH